MSERRTELDELEAIRKLLILGLVKFGVTQDGGWRGTRHASYNYRENVSEGPLGKPEQERVIYER